MAQYTLLYTSDGNKTVRANTETVIFRLQDKDETVTLLIFQNQWADTWRHSSHNLGTSVVITAPAASSICQAK